MFHVKVRLLLAIWLFVAALPASGAADFSCLPGKLATSSKAERIIHYDVRLSLQPDGSLLVDECVQYDFGSKLRHGIFRDIPTRLQQQDNTLEMTLKLLAVQMDGYTTDYSAAMNYSGEHKNLRLRLGRKGVRLTGLHAWHIRYRVEDVLQQTEGDRFRLYWNTIGTGWNVPIHESDSWYQFPPSLQQADIALRTFTGRTGATTSEAVADWPDAHRLHLHNGKLSPREGLSVEMDFPAASLPEATVGEWRFTLESWGVWVLLLLNVSVLGLIWLFIGKEPRLPFVVFRKLLPDVEAAMAGLIADGLVDTRDLEAGILELAADGYLRIEQHGTTGVRLCKLKHEGEKTLPAYRRKLLNVLFGEGHALVLDRRNFDQQRMQRLQTGLDEVKAQMNAHAVEQGYFDSHPKRRLLRFFFIWSFLLVLQCGALLTQVEVYISFIPAIIMPGFLTLSAYLYGLWVLCLYEADVRLGGVILLLFGALGAWGLGFAWMSVIVPFTLLLLCCGLLIAVMPRRGLKGAVLYAHIRKLRQQLEKPEDPLFVAKLRAQPEFAGRLVPYAVALDRIESIVDVADRIHLDLPPWYRGGTRWVMLHGTLGNLSAATTLNANSVSGAGGVGGGFGGGGGGSW